MPEAKVSKSSFKPSAPMDRSVGTLASEALSVLVARRGAQAPGLSEKFLVALYESAGDRDPQVRNRTVRAMLAARISRLEIADLYIPEVARRMGEAWSDDGMSFADVTIGVARLQGLLRELTEHWSADARMHDNGLNIVVLVLADEHHTLGPMLLTSQLRRLGASVRLMLGRPLTEVRSLLNDQNFDAILVSVAHVERLAPTGELIRVLRNTMSQPTPIIVGGPAIDLDEDAMSLTHADHLSNDIEEALRLCGLMDVAVTPPPLKPGA